MTDKEKKYLSDISNSIALIENFTGQINSFQEYQKDLKTKSAVERHLGIIGEAVNQFLRANNSNTLENASKIISLRNRLSHAYDGIDDAIIWTIVKRHISSLKAEVDALLLN
jgi:uncharacterized protein with HEPN domain